MDWLHGLVAGVSAALALGAPGTVFLPPTCTLSAASGVYYPGSTVRLVWYTERASTAEITSLGPIPVAQMPQGFRDVTPSQSTLYTMTVANAAGARTCAALVTITPTPQPTTYYYQPQPTYYYQPQTRLISQPSTYYYYYPNTVSYSPSSNWYSYNYSYYDYGYEDDYYQYPYGYGTYNRYDNRPYTLNDAFNDPFSGEWQGRYDPSYDRYDYPYYDGY